MKTKLLVIDPRNSFSSKDDTMVGVNFHPDIVRIVDGAIKEFKCGLGILSNRNLPYNDILTNLGLSKPVDYIFKDERELAKFLKPRMKTLHPVIMSTNIKYRKLGSDNFVLVNYNTGITNSDIDTVRRAFFPYGA